MANPLAWLYEGISIARTYRDKRREGTDEQVEFWRTSLLGWVAEHPDALIVALGVLRARDSWKREYMDERGHSAQLVHMRRGDDAAEIERLRALLAAETERRESAEACIDGFNGGGTGCECPGCVATRAYRARYGKEET